MKDDQATYQLIEAYLEGLLSEAERLAFEQRLLNEPELQEAVELEADVHRAIQYQGRRELKERLRQIDAQIPSRKARPRFFTWWKLVASLFLLLTPVLLWWALDWNESPDHLYRETLATYTPALERAGGDAMLAQSLRAWSQQDYDDAAASLDLYIAEEAAISEIFELRGLIALKQEEYTSAETQLRSALELEPGRQSSRFYLAMVLFKQDQPGECKSLLQSIIPDGGSYADKAEEFLQSMD